LANLLNALIPRAAVNRLVPNIGKRTLRTIYYTAAR
jgi:hypothetical protein